MPTIKEPTTTTQMIEQIATALKENDIERLITLQAINQDWIQTDNERESMDRLIHQSMVKIRQVSY